MFVAETWRHCRDKGVKSLAGKGRAAFLSAHPHLFSGKELADHALLFASAQLDVVKAVCRLLRNDLCC